MKVLSHPFRFNPLQPGTIATVEQGTDAQKAQEISSFVLTHKGQRPIYQGYGIEDPTFNQFDSSEAAADFATFYTNITLSSITITSVGASTTSISVVFD